MEYFFRFLKEYDLIIVLISLCIFYVDYKKRRKIYINKKKSEFENLICDLKIEIESMEYHRWVYVTEEGAEQILEFFINCKLSKSELKSFIKTKES